MDFTGKGPQKSDPNTWHLAVDFGCASDFDTYLEEFDRVHELHESSIVLIWSFVISFFKFNPALFKETVGELAVVHV
jgi:hypothetical protein